MTPMPGADVQQRAAPDVGGTEHVEEQGASSRPVRGAGSARGRAARLRAVEDLGEALSQPQASIAASGAEDLGQLVGRGVSSWS